MSRSLRALPLLVATCLLQTGCANVIQQVSRELSGAPKNKPVTATDGGFSSAAPTGDTAPARQVEFEAGKPVHGWVTVNETLGDIPHQKVYVTLYWTANPELADPKKFEEFIRSQEDAYKPNWDKIAPGDYWRTEFLVPASQPTTKLLSFPIIPAEVDVKDEDRMHQLHALATAAASRAKYTALVRYSWSATNEPRYDTFHPFTLDTSKGSYDAMELAASNKVVIPNPRKVDAALEKEIAQAASLKYGPAEKKTYFKTILDAEDWALSTSSNTGEVVGRVMDVWVLARSKDKKACYAEQMEARQQHMGGGTFGQSTIYGREKVHRVDCARFKGM